MSRFTHLAIFHATKQLYQNLERGRKKKEQNGEEPWRQRRDTEILHVIFVKRGRLQTLETVKLTAEVAAKRIFPVE